MNEICSTGDKVALPQNFRLFASHSAVPRCLFTHCWLHAAETLSALASNNISEKINLHI